MRDGLLSKGRVSEGRTVCNILKFRSFLPRPEFISLQVLNCKNPLRTKKFARSFLLCAVCLRSRSYFLNKLLLDYLIAYVIVPVEQAKQGFESLFFFMRE
jgi:hypothetical protein